MPTYTLKASVFVYRLVLQVTFILRTVSIEKETPSLTRAESIETNFIRYGLDMPDYRILTMPARNDPDAWRTSTKYIPACRFPVEKTALLPVDEDEYAILPFREYIRTSNGDPALFATVIVPVLAVAL